MRGKRDLAEIFGYAADDTSRTARTLWNLGACPFTNCKCIKHNHDQSIIYGTCSVRSSGSEIIICPNRLYANDYETIRCVARDAFGGHLPFYRFSDFVKNRKTIGKCVVALGQNSGKEIKLGQSLSMDWVLAKIENGSLKKYVGIEVQSIDITGNYRDAWHGYKNLPKRPGADIPASAHGLNWANVHKRLIPQLIRKGLMYSKSDYVDKGLYFIIPEIVFQKFEALLGQLPSITQCSKETISVHTYALGSPVKRGQQRKLRLVRNIRFLLQDMSTRFVTGPNLPAGDDLDYAVKTALGVI